MRFSYFKIFLGLALALSAVFLYLIFLYQPQAGPTPPLSPPIVHRTEIKPVSKEEILRQRQQKMLAEIKKREEEKWRKMFGQNIDEETLARKKLEVLKQRKEKMLEVIEQKKK